MSDELVAPPRVRIRKPSSRYHGEIGRIILSLANGRFRVKVSIEGCPEIDLRPHEVEPC